MFKFTWTLGKWRKFQIEINRRSAAACFQLLKVNNSIKQKISKINEKKNKEKEYLTGD
jgi:hypothetical protein